MKHTNFLDYCDKANLPSDQHPLLWKSWRFEHEDYFGKCLNEFLSQVQVKKARDFWGRKEGTLCIATILKKYRILKPVTNEMLKAKILNIHRIQQNFDYMHDEDVGIVHFPQIYPKCNCGNLINLITNGFWFCKVCKKTFKDKFYL